jgi:hypothetical protein
MEDFTLSEWYVTAKSLIDSVVEKASLFGCHQFQANEEPNLTGDCGERREPLSTW